MRTLYNLPDGDVEDINKRVASQVLDDDQPNKSYLTISQVCPFCPRSSFAPASSSLLLLPPPQCSFHHGSVEQIIQEIALTDRLLMRNWLLLRGSRIPSTARYLDMGVDVSTIPVKPTHIHQVIRSAILED